MIAERLPELAAMSREEKLEVLDELEEGFFHDGTAFSEPKKSWFISILEARIARFQCYPDASISAAKLQEYQQKWDARLAMLS